MGIAQTENVKVSSLIGELKKSATPSVKLPSINELTSGTKTSSGSPFIVSTPRLTESVQSKPITGNRNLGGYIYPTNTNISPSPNYVFGSHNNTNIHHLASPVMSIYEQRSPPQSHQHPHPQHQPPQPPQPQPYYPYYQAPQMPPQQLSQPYYQPVYYQQQIHPPPPSIAYNQPQQHHTQSVAHFIAPEIINKPSNVCHRCGTTETPEWRRGPNGVRTLCNACGLFHAKLVKRKGVELAAEEVLNNKVCKGKNGRRISVKKKVLINELAKKMSS